MARAKPWSASAQDDGGSVVDVRGVEGLPASLNVRVQRNDGVKKARSACCARGEGFATFTGMASHSSCRGAMREPERF